jgi:phage terminase small subunit
MADKLTEKQKRFADEYLVDLNATRAYQKIYNCKETTAKVNASKLLTNTNIQEYVQKKQNRLTVKVEWTVEDILRDIKKIATNEKNEIRDRIRALELGGKHLGMFTENIKMQSDNTNVNIDLSKLSDAELDQQAIEVAKQILGK